MYKFVPKFCELQISNQQYFDTYFPSMLNLLLFHTALSFKNTYELRNIMKEFFSLIYSCLVLTISDLMIGIESVI